MTLARDKRPTSDHAAVSLHADTKAIPVGLRLDGAVT